MMKTEEPVNPYRNPNCAACVERRLHTAAEWAEFHPNAGTGSVAGEGPSLKK